MEVVTPLGPRTRPTDVPNDCPFPGQVDGAAQEAPQMDETNQEKEVPCVDPQHPRRRDNVRRPTTPLVSRTHDGRARPLTVVCETWRLTTCPACSESTRLSQGAEFHQQRLARSLQRVACGHFGHSPYGFGVFFSVRGHA